MHISTLAYLGFSGKPPTGARPTGLFKGESQNQHHRSNNNSLPLNYLHFIDVS